MSAFDKSQFEENNNNKKASDGSKHGRGFNSMLSYMFSRGSEEAKQKRLEEANAAREERKMQMKAKAKKIAAVSKSPPSAASRSLFGKDSKIRRASGARRLSLGISSQKLDAVKEISQEAFLMIENLKK